MGSIQGLRSEAIALRAKEDTALTISQHLGGVNRALGNQISGIIDQLQGVIAERTKAYNGSMVKISQTIYGKSGIGEKSSSLVFGIIGFTFDLVAPAPDGDEAQKAAKVIENLTKALELVAKVFELRSSVNAAVFAYEKGASQLGLTYIKNKVGALDEIAEGVFGLEDTTLPKELGTYSDPGAVGLVNKRNALMPTYRSNNQAQLLNGYAQTYIGALRKR